MSQSNQQCAEHAVGAMGEACCRAEGLAPGLGSDRLGFVSVLILVFLHDLGLPA